MRGKSSYGTENSCQVPKDLTGARLHESFFSQAKMGATGLLSLIFGGGPLHPQARASAGGRGPRDRDISARLDHMAAGLLLSHKAKSLSCFPSSVLRSFYFGTRVWLFLEAFQATIIHGKVNIMEYVLICYHCGTYLVRLCFYIKSLFDRPLHFPLFNQKSR